MSLAYLLPRDRVLLVDDEDEDLVLQFAWRAKGGKEHKTEYAVRTAYRNRTIALHREIALRIGFPVSADIDHKDGNGLNNCRANLRVATHYQNMQNRSKSAANTSGFKGVAINRKCGKWQVTIQAFGKQRHLGLFDNAESAARVYDRWAKEAHGEFAVLNFPEDSQ